MRPVDCTMNSSSKDPRKLCFRPVLKQLRKPWLTRTALNCRRWVRAATNSTRVSCEPVAGFTRRIPRISLCHQDGGAARSLLNTLTEDRKNMAPCARRKILAHLKHESLVGSGPPQEALYERHDVLSALGCQRGWEIGRNDLVGPRSPRLCERQIPSDLRE